MTDCSNCPDWSDWAAFPDPRRREYLNAPFGPGIYELRRSDTKELVLRGKGKNCAYRMASLLPPPLGQGTRNNAEKRAYVLEHLDLIEYRTRAFTSDSEAMACEKTLHGTSPCLFNT